MSLHMTPNYSILSSITSYPITDTPQHAERNTQHATLKHATTRGEHSRGQHAPAGPTRSISANRFSEIVSKVDYSHIKFSRFSETIS